MSTTEYEYEEGTDDEFLSPDALPPTEYEYEEGTEGKTVAVWVVSPLVIEGQMVGKMDWFRLGSI